MPTKVGRWELGETKYMVTFSMCMIVKNEESVLERCLDSIADLMDEIVIVDTGSTDRTKQIALKYTDKVYDFTWAGDFSKARNFAFEKAACDYIYSADADEVIDEENREKFKQLKETMLSEIDIVQMKYTNQLEYGTIYNYDEELRPKLFKRIRTFRFEEPIHETVVLEPVIYDSDIEIVHKPQESHTSRDIAAFERLTGEGKRLSKRLHNLYAKELFVSGTDEDCIRAVSFFETSAEEETRSLDEVKEACCVAARGNRLLGKIPAFFKYALKNVAAEGCSEICCELGQYYLDDGDYKEAAVWFYNAAYETECILNIKCRDDLPFQALARCYRLCGKEDLAVFYEEERKNRTGIC